MEKTIATLEVIGEKIRPGVKRSQAYRESIDSYRKHDARL